MYDSVLGRFLSRDPLGLAGLSSLYEFGSDSPADVLDPDGEAVLKGWEGWREYAHLKPYVPGQEKQPGAWNFPGGIYTTPGLTYNEKGEPREGPYLGTQKADFEAFYLSIEYRTHCGECQPPPKGGQPRKGLTAQDYGNSGIYIYDRWEVQIVDPSQRTPPIGNGQVIPEGAGPNAPNVSTPGNPYGVNNPEGYKNWAKCCGDNNWNKLEIWFMPGAAPEFVARLRTRLNGHEVFNGFLIKPSTGQSTERANNPLTEGPIFIQSHWGCKVDFRNPEILTGPDTPKYPTK